MAPERGRRSLGALIAVPSRGDARAAQCDASQASPSSNSWLELALGDALAEALELAADQRHVDLELDRRCRSRSAVAVAVALVVPWIVIGTPFVSSANSPPHSVSLRRSQRSSDTTVFVGLMNFLANPGIPSRSTCRVITMCKRVVGDLLAHHLDVVVAHVLELRDVAPGIAEHRPHPVDRCVEGWCIVIFMGGIVAQLPRPVRF